MATPARSFLLPLLAFTGVCAVVLFGLLKLVKAPVTAHYAIIFLYFVSITFFLHHWQEKSLITDPKGFVRRFMTGLVLKMFASVAVLVVLMLTLPKDIMIPFTLSFALAYLAYLTFSTNRLVRLSKGPTA